ncbi:MAG TPA: isoamylase early set domain-containing protein [Desulfomicrobiaceae bacterium]|nr:isoamylase early set domain-containing protein [Desulfomicrobiaceae bacterium]
MSIEKKYLKTRPVCKVTFRLPEEHADGAGEVAVVGDFNAWDPLANPMRKLKKGGFSLTVDLEPGREYEFRYLVDRLAWENDGGADGYRQTPYGDGENCLLVL